MHQSRGMTLIETIVGIGILTMGIVGGLALAIASLSSSSKTLQQIIATNLAREGIEVVRKIRDQNWDSGSLEDCDSVFGTTDDQLCIRTWDRGIAGSAAGRLYRAIFYPSTNRWYLWTTTGGSYTRLYLRADGTYSHLTPGAWQYSRQIVLRRDTAAPFSVANPRLHVQSTVWWSGKQCRTTDNPAMAKCKVTVEEYLTNWRNF